MGGLLNFLFSDLHTAPKYFLVYKVSLFLHEKRLETHRNGC
jgi:hypothetical protein